MKCIKALVTKMPHQAQSTQDARCDAKEMEPIDVNGSVHTAASNIEAKTFQFGCASRVLCGLGLRAMQQELPPNPKHHSRLSQSRSWKLWPHPFLEHFIPTTWQTTRQSNQNLPRCWFPKHLSPVWQTLLLGVFENRHWAYLVKCWPIEQNLEILNGVSLDAETTRNRCILARAVRHGGLSLFQQQQFLSTVVGNCQN